MKLAPLFRYLLVALLAISSVAYAAERGTPTEAKAMLDRAVAHVKAVGAEKAFADFSGAAKEWHDKDLYVFAVKFDGMTLAHGGNKGLVGKNLIGVMDPNGKYFIKDMIDAVKAKGSTSVDYSFTDPVTKKMHSKTSYVTRIPGYDGLLGVGVYKQ